MSPKRNLIEQIRVANGLVTAQDDSLAQEAAFMELDPRDPYKDAAVCLLSYGKAVIMLLAEQMDTNVDQALHYVIQRVELPPQ